MSVSNPNDEEKKIMIEDVQVADPEIAFKLKLDKTQITTTVAGVELRLTLEAGKKIYKSEMYLGRSIEYKKPQMAEMVNNELYVIFPFIDPHYKAGQQYDYELEVTLLDLNRTRFLKKTLTGKTPITTMESVVNYEIQGDTAKFNVINKTFKRPGNGKLKIFDPVIGKAGLGVRISWGEDLDVWKVRLVGGFEDGKGTVNVWLNSNMAYKPKYLPLTVFVPNPKGVVCVDEPPYSFSVYLYDKTGKEIGCPIESSIPWSVGQRLPV